MATETDYKDLEKEIIEYIKIRGGASSGLEKAYEKNGALLHASTVLASQKQEIVDYQAKLFESIAAEKQSLDEISKQTTTSEKDKKRISALQERLINETSKQVATSTEELKRITFLQDRLKDLETTVKKSKSSWTRRKAMSEFVSSMEKGKKTKQGFFSSLSSYFGGMFSFPSAKKLKNSKSHLGYTINTIRDKANNRMKINLDVKKPKEQEPSSPSVTKVAPEVNAAVPSITEPKISNGAPPPPPPPQELANSKPATKKSAPSGRNDLLSSIRKKGEQRQKVNLSKDHVNASGEIDFTYIKIEPKSPRIKTDKGIMGAMNSKISSNKENLNIILDGLDPKKQGDMMYSALLDGNTDLVNAFKSHKSEFDTGKTDGEWDEPVMELRATFSDEYLSNIEQSVAETAERIEAGIDIPKQKRTPASSQAAAKTVNKQQATKSRPVSTSEKQKDSTTTSADKKTLPPPAKAAKKTAPNVANLLSDIQKKRSLKSTKTAPTLNIDGFTYITANDTKHTDSDSLESALLKRRKSVEGLDEQFKSMNPKTQLNILYSAIIDDDQEKIEEIHEVGSSEIFTKNAVLQACATADKVVNNMHDVAQKERIKHAIKITKKEFGISQTKAKSPPSLGRT